MKWMKRLRGAIGMGLTWAVGWAVAGILIGVASLLFPAIPWEMGFRVFDAPLPALAIPGFVAGMIFSLLLGIAARRRRFDELSLPQFAAGGALGGLLLVLVPVALLDGGSNLWQAAAIIGGPFMILGALSATATLAVARRAETRELPSGIDADDFALSDAEKRELLGG